MNKNKSVAASIEQVKETVLLVDDNPVNLTILFKTLEGHGYNLLTANGGEAALAIAKEVKPSLILLDIVMPDMDGYMVCELLKQDPNTESVAVIFLSALEDSSSKVRGFAVGGVDYISKPFQSDEVVARVRTHIKIHRLERQLAQRNIELETENHRILNTISEGIIGLDENERITTLNPSAVGICGWSADDAMGKKLSELGLFSDRSKPSKWDGQALPYSNYHMGQAGYSDMEVVYRRDDTQVPIAVTSTPRPDGGAVIVLRDISEWVVSEEALRLTREELESQRQNMAHMERLSTTGEMAAGIAHEVNQPLTAITNYSRVAKRVLARDDVDKEGLGELLDKLSTQAARASDVIQRMRGYVRKPNVGQEPTDINTMMKEVIALAEVDSRINDVSVHFFSDQKNLGVVVDVVQIQQVALNLIRNAMEATVDSDQRDKGVVVRTSRSASDVIVEVFDSGSGVDEAVSAKLFDPFFTTKSNGMGVGLSICQSIINAHGGTIGYRPNNNCGSVFHFSLPLAT
jgi:PAS domain S-box-containing protein